MDPDQTPDPTPFYSNIKDANFLFTYLSYYSQAHYQYKNIILCKIFVLKFYFVSIIHGKREGSGRPKKACESPTLFIRYLCNLDEVDELRHAAPVLIPCHPVHLIHQQHTLLVHLHINVLATKYLPNINNSTINPPMSSLVTLPLSSKHSCNTNHLQT